MRIHARAATWVAALTTVFLASAPVAAKIRISESTNYYNVSGRTGTELGRSMIAGGSNTTRLYHAIAATATRFSFRDPRIVVERGRCVLKQVDVVLDITYYFPKWEGKPRAGASLRRDWDRFYAELVRHEQMHGTIAKRFATRIEKEMLRMRGNVVVGCRDFGFSAQRRFDQLASELKAQQVAFDAREQLASSKISQLQVRLLNSR